MTFTRTRIIKNFLVLSVASLEIFCSYEGLVMLQSTLNSEQGIGVMSVAVQYVLGILSALLFSKYLIQKLGSKIVLTLSMLFYLPFILANAYPHWASMILTSILVGITNSLFWASLCIYLNELAILYTESIKRKPKYRNLKHDKIHIVSYVKSDLRDNELRRDFAGGTVDDHHKVTTFSDDIPCGEDESATSNTEDLRDDFVDVMFKGNMSKNNKQIDKNGAISSTEEHKSEKSASSSHASESEEESPRYSSEATESDTEKSQLLASTTARFFGYHGLIFQTCHIWSNLISYYVLSAGAQIAKPILNSTCLCGADFCSDQVNCFEGNLQPPKEELRYTLMAIFLVLGILSVLTIGFLLDSLQKKEECISLSVEQLSAAFKFIKNPKQILVVPITVYMGILQGFNMGDYTQAYVGCAWGVGNVALVNTCFGVGLSVSSPVSGWLVKYTGRAFIFLFAEALSIGAAVALLLWRPDSEQPAAMFIIGTLLGYTLGSFWSQLRAFYGILFKGDEEVAFGCYQIWHSVGCTVAFACSSYVCTSIKIYSYTTLSVVAVIGYFSVERFYLKSGKDK